MQTHKLFQLFDEADKHLQRPRIKMTVNGQPITIKRKGFKIYVNGTYPQWLATITEGNIQIMPDGCKIPELFKLLQALCQDPEYIIGAYGRRAGVCCFCSQGLTDERSTRVGYGPICADKFGLPWGQPQAAAC